MNDKKSYSNIAVAIIFFVIGIGIGGIIGAYNGYNLGYKKFISHKKLYPDTVKIYEYMEFPEKLKTEYGYD